MKIEMVLTTERVDDFVLLIEIMKKMGLPEIIDRHIPRHWLQKGLSWGWVVTIWLSHIISQGDHRKLTVRDWVRQAHETLQRTIGKDILDTDFTDDRLTIVLRELSNPDYWRKIETELDQRTIRVYDLDQERVRLDATTVSGYHQEQTEGLFQFGNSKDDPTLRQIKIMIASLDPLGFPLTTEVVSGERADDGLYVPAIDRVDDILSKKGLLFVGDCKMSSQGTRAHIHQLGHHYLTPLAMVGETARQMETWIQQGLQGDQPMIEVYRHSDEGKDRLLVSGYEIGRTCTAQEDSQMIQWQERIFIVHSDEYAKTMERGLERRLNLAISKLELLTPASGRGKRQITDEPQLHQKARDIFQKHRVEGLIDYSFERQEDTRTQYVGRGRGGQNRDKRTISRVRYQISSVTRREEAIADLKATFGWKAFATDETSVRMSLENAVMTYRGEWLIERGFHRLKGAPLSMDPVFVKRNDQVEGLTYLLSIAIRILTLIEFVVRRNLRERNENLAGLHPENPKKMTDSPTTERILKAFSNITLSVVNIQGQIVRHITPLSDLQKNILNLLGLSIDIYRVLENNSS